MKENNVKVATAAAAVASSNNSIINANQYDYAHYVSFQTSICIDMVKKMFADEKFALRVDGLKFVVKLFK